MKKIILLVNCFIFIFASYLLAAEKVGKEEQSKFNYLKKEQARFYRMQGLRLQEEGNLGSALQLYQKAAELDPACPEIYNDLGIIYEAYMQPDRAEESYLQAIMLDPELLAAYTNLALLYESRRQLEKAASYWRQRIELGSPDDPWTIKAQQRVQDINLVLSGDPAMQMREQEINDLAREISERRAGQNAGR